MRPFVFSIINKPSLITSASDLGALQRIFFKKSEITIEVGEWVQVSLRIFFFLENRPKIALNQC